MNLKNGLSTHTGWEIIENELDQDQIITTGSNFLVGNGYLGYRGTLSEWRANQYTACIVADTYDNANGEWRELCNIPNGLYTQLSINSSELVNFPQKDSPYQRTLDLKKGTLKRKQSWTIEENHRIHLESERFASFDRIHLIAQRFQISTESPSDLQALSLKTGIDGLVWSLQGDHFQRIEIRQEGDLLISQLWTVENQIQIVVVEAARLLNARQTSGFISREDRSIFRNINLLLNTGEQTILEKYLTIYTSNDVDNPLEAALKEMETALKNGYQALQINNSNHWAEIWQRSDIQIEGNLEDQVLTRFNLYHNIIATPTHAHLPIGARGLSTQVYQGAAFWDQEIFNLPMFIYTQPETASNILQYRYETLDGARHKAKRLGYEGAFYAWTSGKTGRELFPDYFFTDVLTGRKVRNHFNDWQIHISPDIVYAVCKYYQATEDQSFLIHYGAEIVFEVARFLFSHAFYNMDRDRYEFIRLLGPDEYHENIDNNAFTNYQAHFSLEKAIHFYQWLAEHAPQTWTALKKKLGLTDEEIQRWQTMMEKLYLPEPDPITGRIEQFDGFFSLEDTTPKKLKERLLHPDEYWGWPNGIAVHTQVLKQADVIQLLSLHDLFPLDVIRANFDYYEPRTEHGSSLSPSVHAQVACKARYLEKAYAYFKESAAIDLYQKSKKVFSGGSFLGGIHTAACGATWEIIVMGFAGFRIDSDLISFKPQLPDSWKQISFGLVLKNQRIRVTADRDNVEISSHPDNTKTIPCSAFGSSGMLTPGKVLNLSDAQSLKE